MKTLHFRKSSLAIAAAAGLALSTLTVAAQNSATAAPVQLSYGASQIVQLARAKVSDDTIIAYIHSSGHTYGLDADQIIYLRQQGISDAIVNAMLSQPKIAPAQPVTEPDNSYTAPASTADTQASPQNTTPATVASPVTTYVQAAPPSTVYVLPNNPPYYYSTYAQPYYSYGWPYPAVSLSFGFGGHWGGGWRGGVGFHGGGWHR